MSEQLLKEIIAEVKKLSHRFDNLEENQVKTASKVDNIENSFGKLEVKVDKLGSAVGKLEVKVDNLETNQLKLETRIENEVIDKIRILFDTHTLYMDYFASIRDSQARIEDGIGSLFRRSIDTDARIREHDRELRLLRIEKQS